MNYYNIDYISIGNSNRFYKSKHWWRQNSWNYKTRTGSEWRPRFVYSSSDLRMRSCINERVDWENANSDYNNYLLTLIYNQNC